MKSSSAKRSQVDTKFNKLGAVILGFPFILLLSKPYINKLFVDQPTLFWIADILCYVVFPILAILLSYRLCGIKPKDYGLWNYRKRGTYTYSFAFEDVVLSTTLFMIILYGINYFLSIFIPVENTLGYYTQKIESFSGTTYVLALLYLSATAAIVEEVFFRGVLYKFVDDLFSGIGTVKIVYISLSSTLFTFIHLGYDVVGMVAVFVLGVVACLLYLRSKHLEHLIIAHFITDVVVL